jgi:hypothetical protein
MKACDGVVEIFVVAEVLQENRNADNPTRKARLNPKGTTRPTIRNQIRGIKEPSEYIFCEISRSRQQG